MRAVGAILVGGKSLRMGRTKALLEVDGEALVDRTFSILSQLKPYIEEIVISGVLPGRDTIQDENPFSGPIEGIRTVAKTYLDKMGALFVVPVDLPLLEAKSLLPLFIEFEKQKPTAVYFENNPLPALFALNYNLIEKSKQNKSVRGLLMGIQGKAVTVTDTLFLTNTNTPEEWAEIKGTKK